MNKRIALFCATLINILPLSAAGEITRRRRALPARGIRAFGTDVSALKNYAPIAIKNKIIPPLGNTLTDKERMLIAKEIINLGLERELLQGPTNPTVIDGTEQLGCFYRISEEQINALRSDKEDLNSILLADARNGDVLGCAIALTRGANPNFHNTSHETPLHAASWYGHTTIARLLLAYGAQSNTRNMLKELWITPSYPTGFTPLHCACYKGHTDIAQLLLEQEALQLGKNKPSQLVSIVDSERDTPLHVAAWKGHLNIVALLVRHKANVHARNKYKFTPLLNACSDGHLQTAHYLLEHGAKVNAIGDLGRTALDIAQEGEYRALCALLRIYGAID